ncbi:transposase [Brevifollis gellanilyticus]|uniref:transposase n=1 Tax=Brevifollis gellanilyticus TaxID=748831 RepID=UPI001C3F5EB7|nr:transposase [Brevifollis gellanilyticus]
MPAKLQAEWQQKRNAWLHVHGVSNGGDLNLLTVEDRQEYHRKFTAKFHEFLDAGHGGCVLAQKANADLVIARLLAGHGKAYQLDAWCVMPNHIHALVEPAEKMTLGEVMRHWKGGSSRDINQRMGRKGSLWQREPFDHIVRSEAQLEHFRRYVADNPGKARLRTGYVVGRGSEVTVRAHAL